MKNVLKYLGLVLLIMLFICFIFGALGIANIAQSTAALGKFVHLMGEDLRYVEQGSGPDVLLIHGTPGSIEDMYPLIDSLSKDHRVIAYDRPGHGYSSANDADYNLDHNLKIAKAFIDHFKMDSVHVIGHSYGGCIAMKMATEGHAKVKHIHILGSPLFKFKPEFIYRIFSIPLFETIMSFAASQGYAQFKIANELPKRFARSKQALLTTEKLSFRKDLWSQPKVIIAKSLETISMPKDCDQMVPKYKRLKSDITIMMGNEEVPEYISQLREHLPLPRAEVIFLDECAHFIQIEALDELLKSIRSIQESKVFIDY